MTRVVTCDLVFEVTASAEIAVQVVAADSAARVLSERFEVATDGAPPASLEEIHSPRGERIYVILADPGRLSIAYRAELLARPPSTPGSQPFSCSIWALQAPDLAIREMSRELVEFRTWQPVRNKATMEWAPRPRGCASRLTA